MTKAAISVTLQEENLTWLKGRVRAERARSVSEVLDRLIADARDGRASADVLSVVGTIDVDPADPLLLRADDAVRALVAESIGRPFVAKEAPVSYGPPPRTRKRRRA